MSGDLGANGWKVGSLGSLPACYPRYREFRKDDECLKPVRRLSTPAKLDSNTLLLQPSPRPNRAHGVDCGAHGDRKAAFTPSLVHRAGGLRHELALGGWFLGRHVPST
jgi:hypothetical protein